VTIETDLCTFGVNPLGNMPEQFKQILREFSGRFLVRDHLILTAIVSPRIS